MFGDHSRQPNRWTAIAIAAALLAQPALAEQTGITSDMTAKRITLAGGQRMLAESMAKSLCFVQSDIQPEAHRAALSENVETYSTTHLALLEGDANTGLPAEKDPKAIQHWRDVDSLWTEMSSDIRAAGEGHGLGEAKFERLMLRTDEMASLSTILIADLRAQHAQEVTGSGGMLTGLLIDLYERQLMLGEMLSKEVCLVTRDFQTEKTQAMLIENMQMLEHSMTAFQNGMPELGIPPAPTPDIAHRLASAAQNWQMIAPLAESAKNGQAVSKDDLIAFDDGMSQFLLEINAAIRLLVKHEASQV